MPSTAPHYGGRTAAVGTAPQGDREPGGEMTACHTGLTFLDGFGLNTVSLVRDKTFKLVFMTFQSV
jgi:hypothetical protein